MEESQKEIGQETIQIPSIRFPVFTTVVLYTCWLVNDVTQVGIVTDAAYHFRTGQIKYLVSFNGSKDWYGFEELYEIEIEEDPKVGFYPPDKTDTTHEEV